MKIRTTNGVFDLVNLSDTTATLEDPNAPLVYYVREFKQLRAEMVLPENIEQTPNCKEAAFKRFLAAVESKVSEGWDRLRASFDVVRGTGKILTDYQWERLTGVPQVDDEEHTPEPETEDDDLELLTLTIDATGETVEAIFLEEDVLFVTVEEEPRMLNPEDVTL